MDAGLEEVKKAAKAAGAHDFIKKLPMQYHTYLEETGNVLSGGEKQRIALARAFLEDSQFYILDESTSNLDFKMVYYQPWESKYLSYLVVQYDADVYAKEVERLRNCSLSDYHYKSAEEYTINLFSILIL